MEYWDLYDYKGNKKDKIALRGTKLNNDEFHLVINAWIMNDKGEFLITQRNANKSHPLMWECTGGSALLGESSLQAAIREIKEELNIDVLEEDAMFIGESRRFYESCPDILQVWLFKSNVDIKDVKIQEEEVNDVMWASKEKILQLFKDNKFEANSFFNKVINMSDNSKIYYIGYDENSVMYKEKFFDGMITIYPNGAEENIYYTKDNIEDIYSEEFLVDYKEYLIDTMSKITDKHKNVSFFITNRKIRELLNDENNFNIVGVDNYSLIDKLNNKKYVNELFEDKVPIIDIELLNDKYRECLPINVTVVIGKHNNVVLPTSVELSDNKFKYVGDDFIYTQKFNDKIKDQINKYNSIIINEIKNNNYKGILNINYIVDSSNSVYFTGINFDFPVSTIAIDKYLSKYCCVSILELYYLAITDGCIGNTYLDVIDNSFINCINNNEYKEFEHFETINNETTYFGKLFNYSVLKNSKFQKIE